ncbi:MAG: Tex family protein [Pseudomonadales bacterium]
MQINEQLATELNVNVKQIDATVALLDQGDTVPFIARYRKEVTGALDDTQLRNLAERLDYLCQLDTRRQSIIQSIEQQGKLTSQLAAQIAAAKTKVALEDLYLPYKPQRRGKAQKALAAGLEPLLRELLSPTLKESPQRVAARYLKPQAEIHSADDALLGAEHILIEQQMHNPLLLGQLRHTLSAQGILHSKVKRGQKDDNSKFRDYFDFTQALNKVPAHRAQAIFRGVAEGVLKLDILPGERSEHHMIACITEHLALSKRSLSARNWLQHCAQSCWQNRMLPHLAAELSSELQSRAEESAIGVFATNLKDLLMAAPAGARATLGLDPGLRTGVKVAAVDATGKLLEFATIYPHAPQKKWDHALATLEKMVARHAISLVSVGNGTASRETEHLVRELKLRSSQAFESVVVSEAGASVYSASALASHEFPDIDVSIRGAISIARRLQDPLAELVKVEPKAIGVGQYQHDVNQKALAAKLSAVVEDCVNSVGVNLNSASAALLQNVAGINVSVAENIVAHRDQHGPFKSRRELRKVKRLGDKAFQQCAGFMRIPGAKDVLDNSAVHPESYSLVQRMANTLGVDSATLVADKTLLARLDVADYIDEFGRYTVQDVLQELAKPGRDPRPEFKTAQFDEQVNTLQDLQQDMHLEGVVTNVTNFGAFVDIGVHQDGLVHISQLSNTFVRDPHQVVHTGQIVSVKVMEVDLARKRISLTMKG